eukprot:159115_1
MQNHLIQRLEAPPEEETAQYLNSSMQSLEADENSNKAQIEPKLSEHWTRYFMTEFIGTFISTIMADAIFYNLSQENYTDLVESGFLFLSIGVAMAYFIGILICRDANLNIIFTFALAICNAKRWLMVPLIIISQFMGGICGHAMFFYLINGKQYEKDSKLAFCFGVIFPSNEISNSQCFISSIIFTAILIVSIIPVFAPELGGVKVSHSTGSLLVALLIFALVLATSAFGSQNNPTLWFSAYIFMWMIGFDKSVFSKHDNYWWVALIGPIVGVIVAIIILIWFPIILWYEPKHWKKAFKRAINP